MQKDSSNVDVAKGDGCTESGAINELSIIK